LLIVDSIVNGVVVATRPLRWIVFGRNCSRRRSRRGGWRGRIVVVVSPSPSSPAEDKRAEACGRGPWLSPSLRWWLAVTMACCGGWRGGNGSSNRYHRLILIVMLHGSVKIGLWAFFHIKNQWSPPNSKDSSNDTAFTMILVTLSRRHNRRYLMAWCQHCYGRGRF
jgi:hypothetical protein